MREVCVLGVGMHPWGKFPQKSIVEMGIKATRDALQDANLDWRDIQAVAAGEASYWGMTGLLAGHQLAKAMGETGIPIINIYNACATSGSAIKTARDMIASGLCDIALAVGLDWGVFGGLQPNAVHRALFQVAFPDRPSKEAAKRSVIGPANSFDLTSLAL